MFKSILVCALLIASQLTSAYAATVSIKRPKKLIITNPTSTMTGSSGRSYWGKVGISFGNTNDASYETTTGICSGCGSTIGTAGGGGTVTYVNPTSNAILYYESTSNGTKISDYGGNMNPVSASTTTAASYSLLTITPRVTTANYTNYASGFTLKNNGAGGSASGGYYRKLIESDTTSGSAASPGVYKPSNRPIAELWAESGYASGAPSYVNQVTAGGVANWKSSIASAVATGSQLSDAKTGISALVTQTNILITNYNNAKLTDATTSSSPSATVAAASIASLKSEVDLLRREVFTPLMGLGANFSISGARTNAVNITKVTATDTAGCTNASSGVDNVTCGGMYTSAAALALDGHKLTMDNGTVTYATALPIGIYSKSDLDKGILTKTNNGYDGVVVYVPSFGNAFSASNQPKLIETAVTSNTVSASGVLTMK